MSVRVTPTVQSGDTVPFVHDDADSYNEDPRDVGSALLLFDAKGNRVATYAPGCWASAEKLTEPEPAPVNPESSRTPSIALSAVTEDEIHRCARALRAYGASLDAPLTLEPFPVGTAAEPPLLRSGTVVRIPGIDVPYVVDKGLATSGAHATLTFTTVDRRDWSDERTVNAAAESVGDYAANGSRLRSFAENAAATAPYPGWAKCPSVTLVPKPERPAGTSTDADPSHVLLETGQTSEPYVSVNLSVTSDDADAVLKVIRKAFREVPEPFDKQAAANTLANLLRKVVREHGAEAFGLVGAK